MKVFHLFVAFLFWPFYVVFLLVMTMLWPLSLIFRDSGLPLEQGLVFASPTICRVLFDRSLISEEDYMFEHTLVVDSYNLDIFKGYRVLTAPVIGFLNRSHAIDRQVLYFVRCWIRVQKQRLLGEGQAHWFHRGFTVFAVSLAKATARHFAAFF